ncbi:hydroxypyruvate isomerase [Alphaproteobacteria bacterium 46_93_T64]|nr:hydroxypyruvate isomerase [Alphaproteobacteria bacterium 46_93_T64]
MIKLAANLAFLYQEFEFLDRFSMATRDGFTGVEYLFPYDWQPLVLKKHLEDNGLKQVLFNLSPGDWNKGERGLASLPDRQLDFQETVSQALDYAAELDCRSLHVMAGLTAQSVSKQQQEGVFVENLLWASAKANAYDIDLLIEPINRQDMPNYFLSDFEHAAEIIETLNLPNLKLQFDIYHCQKIHGEVPNRLSKYLPITGHIQIANPPGRNEPDFGELNFPHLFDVIVDAGYSGWVGCEYKPSSTTQETLVWAEKYLAAEHA